LNTLPLNTRVTIQQRGTGTDAIGQPLPDDWTLLAVVWANVRHVSGLQAIKADTPVSVVKASVRIRWRTDVHAGLRLLVGAQVYNIAAVLKDMQGHGFVDLVCELVA
jgi:SPP1 family predicted phage head-tail adaptor